MDDSGQQAQDRIHDFFPFQLGESRSSDERGDFMNGKNSFGSCKKVAWIAVLSGAMVTTFSLAAFGQQEVDPTWYDPWAPKTAEVHPAQSAVVQHHAKTKQASSSKRVAKASGKRSANQAKTS
jgi:hypothetical protein